MTIFAEVSRILAIDFGTKRCGIAVTDPDRIIATGLDTIATADIFDFLEDYFKKEQVDTIVVGDPKNLDDGENFLSAKVERLVEILKEKYPNKKTLTIDERYTSKMAMDTLIKSGVSKKTRRKKELLDKISATIILQTYLEQQK